MAEDVKWIKLSTGILDDEKIIAIEDMPEGPTLCWFWIKLLALAGRQNREGMIGLTDEIPYTEVQLANRFRMNTATVQLGLKLFEKYGMIEIVNDMIYTRNWSKYQNIEGLEKIKEQNRIRKANQREREKNQKLEAAKAAPALPEPEKKKTVTEMRLEFFERFWKSYPRKTGKGKAREEFMKAKPNEELTQKMIAAVEASKRTQQWQKEKGQFIPNPATWLHQQRWEDEVEEEIPFYEPNPPAVIRDESIEDWD